MAVSRREILLTSLALTAGCVGGALGRGWIAECRKTGDSEPMNATAIVPDSATAQDALQKLIDGNRRYVEGHATHPHTTEEWRTAIHTAQHPFAAILGCSDSRVPPEVVFDEGLGDLFVVRQAGHVADDDTVGSLEYAVEHLHIPLVVVLGHEQCGAVSAAVGSVVRDEPVEGHILRLIDDIAPAVEEGRAKNSGNLIEDCVRANIRQVVRRLRNARPILRRLEQSGDVRVVGAYYSLQSGVVEWLPD